MGCQALLLTFCLCISYRSVISKLHSSSDFKVSLHSMSNASWQDRTLAGPPPTVGMHIHMQLNARWLCCAVVYNHKKKCYFCKNSWCGGFRTLVLLRLFSLVFAQDSLPMSAVGNGVSLFTSEGGGTDILINSCQD